MKTPTPYIWLQENERRGRAECGCELDNRGDDGPAFYQCSLHETAAQMLEALKGVDAVIKSLLLEHGSAPRGATDWGVVNNGLVAVERAIAAAKRRP